MDLYVITFVLAVVLTVLLFKKSNPAMPSKHLPPELVDEVLKHLSIKEQCTLATVSKSVAQGVHPRRLRALWRELITVKEPHNSVHFYMTWDQGANHIAILSERHSVSVSFHDMDNVALEVVKAKVTEAMDIWDFQDDDGTILWTCDIEFHDLEKACDFMLYATDAFKASVFAKMYIMSSCSVLSFLDRDEKLEACHRMLCKATSR